MGETDRLQQIEITWIQMRLAEMYPLEKARALIRKRLPHCGHTISEMVQRGLADEVHQYLDSVEMKRRVEDGKIT